MSRSISAVIFAGASVSCRSPEPSNASVKGLRTVTDVATSRLVDHRRLPSTSIGTMRSTSL